ncbi:unnamed protein product [Choristocarpus tenellus]
MKTSMFMFSAAALAFSASEVMAFLLPSSLVAGTTSLTAVTSSTRVITTHNAACTCLTCRQSIHSRSCTCSACSSMVLSAKDHDASFRFGACSVRMQASHGDWRECGECVGRPSLHANNCACPACIPRMNIKSCTCAACVGGRWTCLTVMGMDPSSGAESTSPPSIDSLKLKLSEAPESINFEDTMNAIAESYNYTPKRFDNGVASSDAGVNEGSCKVLSMGKIAGLTTDEVLTCFGEHFRSVLEDPNGNSHGNIRAFMKSGWEGVSFPDGLSLTPKA